MSKDPIPLTRRDMLKSAALMAAARWMPVGTIAGTFDAGATNVVRTLSNWDHYLGSLGGPWDVWRTDQAYNVSWKPVEVPHCFNAYDAVDPDRSYYEGPGWYRTRIKADNPFRDGRTLLCFEGAGQKCRVFVGLNQVGQHCGGYDEFVIDITSAISKAGGNADNNHNNNDNKDEFLVAVCCDNSRDDTLIPSTLNDFPRYGGLYRPAHLAFVPAISLQRVHIISGLESGAAKISVKARLYNPDLLNKEVQVLVRLIDPNGKVVHSATQRLPVWEGEREISAVPIRSPELWSPARPALYRCDVILATEYGAMQVSERFGVRIFEFVNHGPFKLNGERLLLRGTQRQEDFAGTGDAIPSDVLENELKLMKAMGANFVRLGHHQQSRAVLEFCDELGLLVWEEIPWSRGGLGGEEYKQHLRDMLRAMLDQHFNHPSIVIWGLGNELDWPGDFPEYDPGKIQSFVKELHEQAHALDPGRLTGLRRCDFAREIVDVYSASIWAGWYHGPYTQYKASVSKEMEKVRHFLHMEWGADSHAGRHSELVDEMLVSIVSGAKLSDSERQQALTSGLSDAPKDGDWSETYACNLFDWHLKEQDIMPSLAGSAQWIFKDFATPLRPENPIPHVNQKGLLERNLRLKEGYYVFQSYWVEEPMVHIYGHSWHTRWGKVGEQKLVKVYSNCQHVELFLNGVSCGLKTRDNQNFPAAGLRWLVPFKAGTNQIRAIGHMGQQEVRDELSFDYQVEKWATPSRIELHEIKRNGQIVTIEARVRDDQGVLCLDARNRVHFALTGDGRLLDNLGTSTGSRSVEVCNGRAEISLLRNEGRSILSVRSDHLPTAFSVVE